MSNYWIFPVFLPNKGCFHRCRFCDQRVVAGGDIPLPAIGDLENLFEKVRFSEKRGKDTSLIRQIAFYGGNFTGLPREVQRRYLDWASDKVLHGWVHSLRFSTRPDALGDDEIAFLKMYPVRTIEIGVQSMNDKVLQTAERGHTAMESERAVEKVVSAGWEAGVQLMPGLPGETREGFLAGVKRITRWGVRFARLYPAVVLKGTRLADDYKEGSYIPLGLEEAVAWCAAATEMFETEGVEVIRVGLPASDRLKRAVIAGPYHPAFGFLVQSYRFHRRLETAMRNCHLEKKEIIEIRLSPRSLPLLMGDRRQGWERLKARWPGRKITYRLDPAFPVEKVRVASVSTP